MFHKDVMYCMFNFVDNSSRNREKIFITTETWVLSIMASLIIVINGYTYVRMFKHHSRLTLYRSLKKTLTHPSCANSAWMENQGSDLSRLRASFNENSLYWVDKDGHVLSLAFPAILHLEKTRNEIESYKVLNDKKVSDVFCVDKFHSWNLVRYHLPLLCEFSKRYFSSHHWQMFPTMTFQRERSNAAWWPCHSYDLFTMKQSKNY